MRFKKEFNFTEAEQSFVVPKTGYYLLEAWGAQGGDTYSSFWKENYIGGFGGYSTGVAVLKKGETIYVVVGQKGGSKISSFNGGGIDNPLYDCATQTSSGGGCTHIAFKSGELKSLDKHQPSVLLVASGGGGSYTRMCDEYGDQGSLNGGHGGGTKGSSPTYVRRGTYSLEVPTGGSQEGPGIATTEWGGNGKDSTTASCIGGFGYGAYSSYGNVWSGAGAGWYGGATGFARAGSGGSGFLANYLISYDGIKKHMSCINCTESDSPDDFTMSVQSSNENPVRDNAKLGDGYAMVTLLHSYISCKIMRNSLSHLSFAIIIVI